MKYKICLNCKKNLSINNFYNNKYSKSGYRANCKKCFNKINAGYRLKKIDVVRNYDIKRRLLRKYHLYFFIQRMYTGMNERVNGNAMRYKNYHGIDICSRKEFTIFAMRNWDLKNLFNNWVKSGYSHKLVPTPDRINNSKGYTLDNIQFLTFIDNSRKR